ncbi:MAG: galactokinase [Planctomycetes bacterium]|nr:galactokinase [Planctomycetota bacterium]
MSESDEFERLLGQRPAARAFAPGRVNLIGEHVDYHDGVVLPVPLDQGTWVAVAPEPGRTLRCESPVFGPAGPYPLEPFSRVDDYAVYPLALIAALRERGVDVPGCVIGVRGTLPIGGGVSSSASYLVATARAIDAWLGLGLDAATHAALAYRAEREFVGVACGTMDQTVAALGRPGHALRFDCRTGATTSIPLPRDRIAVVVVDSGTRRDLRDGRFNARVQESTAAARELAALRPGIRALRDVTPADLEAAAGRIDPVRLRRARHVVDELARVDAFVDALRAGDDARCGSLLDASHASLRDLYEVSTEPLDALVAECRAIPGVLGARLTGAGFGGSIVVWCRREATHALERDALPKAHVSNGVQPRVLAVV